MKKITWKRPKTRENQALKAVLWGEMTKITWNRRKTKENQADSFMRWNDKTIVIWNPRPDWFGRVRIFLLQNFTWNQILNVVALLIQKLHIFISSSLTLWIGDRVISISTCHILLEPNWKNLQTKWRKYEISAYKHPSKIINGIF